MEEQAFSPAQDIGAGQILHWFAELPLGVHLVLAVLALVLFGVAVYSYASRQALRQADEETADLLSERDFQLRRDSYLEAAEAIAKAQDILSKLPAADFGRESAQSALERIAGALGKLHLVASESTLKATSTFETELAACFMDLSLRRRPLVELQNEIDSLDDRISHAGVERDHLLASITRLASDGLEQHGGIWSEMNLRFDKLHREIGNLMAQRGDKLEKLIGMRRELAVETAQRSLKLIKLGVPAYLSLRRELGVPIDELDYRGLIQRHVSELERAVLRMTEVEPRKAPVQTAANAQPAARRKAAGGGERSAAHGPRPASEATLRMVLKRGK